MGIQPNFPVTKTPPVCYESYVFKNENLFSKMRMGINIDLQHKLLIN